MEKESMGEEPGRAYLLPEKGLQGGAGTDLSLPPQARKGSWKAEPAHPSGVLSLALCPGQPH